MGLDVYLYRSETSLADIEAKRERGSQMEANATKELLAKYGVTKWDDLPEAKQDDFYAELETRAIAAGFDKYWDVTETDEEKIELDSKVHPDHMFKIGYFRSSYNAGGTNRVLREAIGTSLDDIFKSTNGEDYYRQVNWADSLKRARDARDAFAKHLKKSAGYSVEEFFPNVFGFDPSKPAGITSQKEALEKFTAQREQWESQEHAKMPRGFGDAFMNKDGHYFFGDSTMEVHAVLEGSKESFMPGVTLPGFYLIVKHKDSIDPETGKSSKPFQWYSEALEDRKSVV